MCRYNSFDVVRIPYEYAARQVVLDWGDVFFGIEQRFFASSAAVDHAVKELCKTDNPDSNVLELAILHKGEDIHPFIDELGNSENLYTELRVRKFLFLALKWVYDNQELYEDPLQVVEMIYADFDYPEEIKGFVRYMPATSASTVGYPRFWDNWEQFLIAEANKWNE